MKYLWALLTLAGAGLPAQAQAADQLDCISAGYTAERERFWSIMTSALGAAGMKTQPTNDNVLVIGVTILRFWPGAGEHEQNTIGALIGMEALLRHTEATFSELWEAVYV